MPEYLHPGVYIEETSFRSPPFEGVSTSTAGLVGRTRKGSEGRPTLVTSFTEFVRRFGEPFPLVASAPPQLGDHLGHAVRAFFDNGGKRAYIVRTLSATAEASDRQLEQGATYVLPTTVTVRGPTRTIPLVSARGIDSNTTLDVFSRDPNGNATLRFQVGVADVDVVRNTITLDGGGIPAGVTLGPSSTFFVDNGAATTATGPVFRARSRGAGGDAISVQVRPTDGPAVRLVAPRFFRGKLVVRTFSGVGADVGPSANTFSLRSNEVRLIMPGDRLELSGSPTEKRDVSSITSTATVAISVTTVAANVPATTPIAIIGRDGTATPAPIAIDTLPVTTSFTAGTTSVALPLRAAVVLRSGDEVQVGGAVFTLTADPDLTEPANNITLGGAPIAAHPATTISVAASAPVSGLVQRLLVADTSGLTAPFDPTTPQQIAITDGATTVAAEVRLVDGVNVYVTSSVAIPASWTSFELLEVAGASGTVSVASTASFYTGAIVELYDGVTKTKQPPFVVTAVDPGARTVTLNPPPALVTVPAEPASRQAFLRTLEIDVLVFESGALVETFPGLSWNGTDPSSDAFQRYYIDRVNDADNGSQLVTVVAPSVGEPADLSGQPTSKDGFPVGLANGSDGGPLTEIDLIGSDNGPGRRFGIEALKERRDIALVAVPGVVEESVQAALLTHCELLKYRFAILDGKRGQADIAQIQAHRGNYDSKYGAYYAPWLETLDLTSGRTILAPPSGYVLGICARVDTERGVHKAPANEVVRNILGIELPFTDGEQDVLNPLGINLIREFEGRGIRVWGARTTTSDQEWKYVNVRRLFIFLEHSIDNGTQFVVFEPNNESLWERVKEAIESFLFGVWKTGALMGTKPEEAFFVRCDRTTMTQDDIDNGRLVCLIGVAPAYPAEFVIFRIGQFTASSNRA
ncbi:MAG: phage tail sheath subtilisin-like domain-containing protein [Deltaproteobacteria bacterium]|nr:phage tail sheath subtilisin-like domain-containing protein [Deltaproteobacteria bacterium]